MNDCNDVFKFNEQFATDALVFFIVVQFFFQFGRHINKKKSRNRMYVLCVKIMPNRELKNILSNITLQTSTHNVSNSGRKRRTQCLDTTLSLPCRTR